jgi:hypothetical protein
VKNNAVLAQRVWETHYAIACCEDSNLSGWDTDVYQGSRNLVLATLRQVYSLSDSETQRVYEILVETGDPV